LRCGVFTFCKCGTERVTTYALIAVIRTAIVAIDAQTAPIIKNKKVLLLDLDLILGI
jgi:hypothetical protein